MKSSWWFFLNHWWKKVYLDEMKYLTTTTETQIGKWYWICHQRQWKGKKSSWSLKFNIFFLSHTIFFFFKPFILTLHHHNHCIIIVKLILIIQFQVYMQEYRWKLQNLDHEERERERERERMKTSRFECDPNFIDTLTWNINNNHDKNFLTSLNEVIMVSWIYQENNNITFWQEWKKKSSKTILSLQ